MQRAAVGVEGYLRTVSPKLQLPESTDAADYLREHGRNAIAHVIRDREDRQHINPDEDATRFRLSGEAFWLRAHRPIRPVGARPQSFKDGKLLTALRAQIRPSGGFSTSLCVTG